MGVLVALPVLGGVGISPDERPTLPQNRPFHSLDVDPPPPPCMLPPIERKGGDKIVTSVIEEVVEQSGLKGLVSRD